MSIRVAIDAGHNCAGDTGARGNGVQEDTVTLRIAEELQAYMGWRGYDARIVNPHRSTGSVRQSLAGRVNNANAMVAEVYISIHCNAATATQAKGTEVYHFPGNETGKTLATVISRDIASIYGTSNRGAKENSNFYVLSRTKMCAVLIELAFVSNASDARNLVDTSKDRAICKAIYDAVEAVFGRNETEAPAVKLAKVYKPEHVTPETEYQPADGSVPDEFIHPDYDAIEKGAEGTDETTGL